MIYNKLPMDILMFTICQINQVTSVCVCWKLSIGKKYLCASQWAIVGVTFIVGHSKLVGASKCKANPTRRGSLVVHLEDVHSINVQQVAILRIESSNQVNLPKKEWISLRTRTTVYKCRFIPHRQPEFPDSSYQLVHHSHEPDPRPLEKVELVKM